MRLKARDASRGSPLFTLQHVAPASRTQPRCDRYLVPVSPVISSQPSVPCSLFPVPCLLLLLGAHTSIAGGTHEAPPRAKAIGATAMQMFTKQANRWAERECDDGEQSTFRAAVSDAALVALNAHDSYL